MRLLLEVLGVFNLQARRLKSTIVDRGVTRVRWEPGINDIPYCCQVSRYPHAVAPQRLFGIFATRRNK
jgi:hypothetical protein